MKTDGTQLILAAAYAAESVAAAAQAAAESAMGVWQHRLCTLFPLPEDGTCALADAIVEYKRTLYTLLWTEFLDDHLPASDRTIDAQQAFRYAADAAERLGFVSFGRDAAYAEVDARVRGEMNLQPAAN